MRQGRLEAVNRRLPHIAFRPPQDSFDMQYPLPRKELLTRRKYRLHADVSVKDSLGLAC